MSTMPPPPPPGNEPATAPPPPPGSTAPPPPPPGAVGGGATAVASDDLALPRAMFFPRFGGWLLDGILYGLLAAAFYVPALVMIIAAFDDCVSIGDELICPDGKPSAALIIAGGLIALAGLVIVIIIYLRALGKTGQTWGRRIVGVKVIDAATGAPIGVWRALGRQLFEGTISSWIFYLGFLWMLWDDQNQTWHDKAVNSVVVKT